MTFRYLELLMNSLKIIFGQTQWGARLTRLTMFAAVLLLATAVARAQESKADPVSDTAPDQVVPEAQLQVDPEVRDFILQKAHTKEAEIVFRDPPPQAKEPLKENWKNLGIRDRFAATINPAIQEVFPDGDIDWSGNSKALEEFAVKTGKTIVTSPHTIPATRAYMNNGARGAAVYGHGVVRSAVIREVRKQYEPGVVTDLIDLHDKARAPLAVPGVALKSMADDVGMLTGVPNSKMREAWYKASNGLQAQLENTMQAGIHAANGDFSEAAQAIQAALDTEQLKGGIGALIAALKADIDKALEELRKETLEQLEWMKANELPPDLSLELDQLLEQANNTASTKRQKTLEDLAQESRELESVSVATQRFRQRVAQINDKARRDMIAQQLRSMTAALQTAYAAPDNTPATSPGATATDPNADPDLYSVRFIDDSTGEGWVIQHNVVGYASAMSLVNFGMSIEPFEHTGSTKIVDGPYKTSKTPGRVNIPRPPKTRQLPTTP